MAALLSYAASFYFVYRDYISTEWAYAGLHFAHLASYEIIIIAFLVGIQGWLMPQRLHAPSAVFIWVLTVIVFVPTILITLMIGERGSTSYYANLASLALIFILASIFSRGVTANSEVPLPEARFFRIFLILFLVSSGVLVLQYASVMSISSLEDVYFQRFAAADLKIFSFVAYVRTHYLYVFCSFLFCCGFLDRKYWYFTVLGCMGFFLNYSIDASKISFVIPFTVLAVVILRRVASAKSWILSAGLAFLTMICGNLALYSPSLKIIADLFLVRSIAIPGQTFAMYADVFYSRGYTWWSNVRGIGMVVSPPEGLASDPFWPVLGLIVGADYHGAASRSNVNANLFAGEGVAAAGSIGVIVIGVAFIAFLRLFDALARRWNQELATLVSVPLALCLSNVHLSTLFLSFGGLFWFVTFYFLRPSNAEMAKS